MNQTSASLLEFDALKQLLRRFVQSPGGRNRLAAMQPTSERRELEALGVETQEAIDYLKSALDPQVAGRADALRLRFDNMPYGGVKRSGFGREGVRFAIEEMTEWRSFVRREQA